VESSGSQWGTTMAKIFDVAFTDVGGFDLADLSTVRIAPRTLTVGRDKPISEIADLITRQNSNLVMIIDSGDQVCGIVEPSYVRKWLGLHRQQAPDDFAECVVKLAQFQVQVPLDRPAWERPVLYWCEIHKHYTSEVPCPDPA
jgi:hypothetical protein